VSPASAPARRPARTGFLTGTGGIAIQIGLAEKFYRGYAGEVPRCLRSAPPSPAPCASARTAVGYAL
jgi:hypothetical protein